MRDLLMLQRPQIAIKTSHRTHNRGINAILKAAGKLPAAVNDPPGSFPAGFSRGEKNFRRVFQISGGNPSHRTWASGGSTKLICSTVEEGLNIV
mgnify:CR=1 FL=1